MATEDLRAYELLKSGKHGIDSVLRSTQHTVATATLTPGQQSMQVYARQIIARCENREICCHVYDKCLVASFV